MRANIDKDANQMKAPFAYQVARLCAVVLAGVSFANAAQDSVVQKQKTLLENLREMDFSNPGVSFSGELRGSYGQSVLDSNAKSDKNTDIGAFSEGDFSIQARPTKDTRATVKFRAHQDWQKSHEEGVNPPMFYWFSYDGITLDKRLKFNLGDMRVHYTPLTMETPSMEFLGEAQNLKSRREDAMAYRQVDGTKDRLMQGLNADYHTGKLSVFDDIGVQSTIARLRNQAKKYDQAFFDFDESDRYLAAGKVAVSGYGVTLGGAYVYSFDREQSAKNFYNQTLGGDTIHLEDNSVASYFANVNIASLIGMDWLKLDLGVEFASSNYTLTELRNEKNYVDGFVDDSNYVTIGDNKTIMVHYVVPRELLKNSNVMEELESLDGSALLISLNAGADLPLIEFDARLKYLSNNEKFQSDLAMSPVYTMPTSVLNANALQDTNAMSMALGMLSSGTIENMYFARYQVNPLQRTNIVSTSGEAVGDNFLYNNYRKSHFVRTGFSNVSMVRSEMAGAYLFDPGVNLDMPFGLATPDRKGLVFAADFLALNKALEVNLRFNQVEQDFLKASYTKIGFGTGFYLGRFLNWSRQIDMNLGYESTAESKGLERSSNAIRAGVRGDVIGGLSLLVGYQTLTKDYGILFDGVNPVDGSAIDNPVEATETIILAGPLYKLDEGSYASLQVGLLTNELNVNSVKTKLNRQIIAADVRVKF